MPPPKGRKQPTIGGPGGFTWDPPFVFFFWITGPAGGLGPLRQGLAIWNSFLRIGTGGGTPMRRFATPWGARKKSGGPMTGTGRPTGGRGPEFPLPQRGNLFGGWAPYESWKGSHGKGGGPIWDAQANPPPGKRGPAIFPGVGFYRNPALALSDCGAGAIYHVRAGLLSALSRFFPPIGGGGAA